MLKLAAGRTAGAHPYLVTPEHTRQARNILGPGKLLAPEQRVVMEADPAKARAVGRPSVVKPYLGLTNYTSNLQRLGFTEQDVVGEGSDRLIDALVISGDGATIARRFEEHHQAGANHVAVQLIAGPGADLDAGFSRLAQILGLSPASQPAGVVGSWLSSQRHALKVYKDPEQARRAGFEPATRCLEGTGDSSQYVASCRLTGLPAAAMIAGSRVASLGVCRCWLPVWPPQFGMPCRVQGDRNC